MKFILYADTQTDIKVEHNLSIAPVYLVTGMENVSYNRYYAFIRPVLSSSEIVDISKTFDVSASGVSVNWKQGYNASVFFESVPPAQASINYNVGDYYTQYHDTHKNWFLNNGFSSIDEMSFQGWGFVSGGVTITFKSKLEFDVMPDFVLKKMYQYGGAELGDFETVCDTVDCSTEQTVDTLSESVETLDDNITEIQEELTLDGNVFTDSSYYESGWSYYSSDYPPRIYKYGKVVTFTGAFTNTASKTVDSSDVKIMTLPEAYRPSQKMFAYCQGSTYNHWVMTVDTDGSVYIRRYGTTSNQSMSANRWLPFTITYVIS